MVLEQYLQKHIDLLIARYPVLGAVKQEIIYAYLALESCYESGGKLLIAGNGGSAADSDHIVGELMKSFKKTREIDRQMTKKLKDIDEKNGSYLSAMLEKGLPAISLVSNDAFSTAYMNDVCSDTLFAQKLFCLGKENDVFLAISTSGDSENIYLASIVAKALGIKIIGLTGNKGGKLATIADVCIKVPYSETYMIQELHLPIYHCLCMMLEERFY